MTETGSVGVVKTKYFTFKDEFFFESGRVISSVTVAYETYGKLNEAKDNAILVCHALTGSAHAAGYNRADEQRPGWWDSMIGPGKAFDTDKYFVICTNFLGSCFGTTGPSSVDPSTGKRYGLRFPVVTIRDMVHLQKKLIDHLGIKQLFCVAGGSMGGMQALEWGATYPDSVKSIIPIATGAYIIPMSIAFNAIAKFAIMKDPRWNGGDYYDSEIPVDGLAIARMAGHITYLSDPAFHNKFGRRYANFEGIYDFKGMFEVENYLRYNGYKFTETFDANTYLYVLKTMDIFDLSYGRGNLEEALSLIKAKSLFMTFTSDFLFPSYQTEEIVGILKGQGKDTSWENITSDYGHDAFLLEFEVQTQLINDFLKRV
ncbi:homoserine O-acetyltransferase [Seleniivibrio sp.]|uniref:homoserine O-acetyltransferase MetX n=1 Tax=Seleniivibrio sp. TaxID=2898801 RepID=UPI0025CDDFBC|nr:homoserine O-acetyltransferase [Seleniivibrio sp.]MCD8553409.1 homoserine O-acetyltransferase [Seleniivibrio sp.]